MVFLIIFIALSFPLSARAQLLGQEDNSFDAHEKIDLMLGIYRDIEMPDLPDESKFKIENRKFSNRVTISWDDDKKVMRFNPKSEGTALITFLDRKTEKVIKQIRVFVNKNDLDRVAKEVKTLLGNIEGIQIKVMSNKVIVDGQIILPSDLNRIVSVIAQYGGRAVSLVQLSPLSMTKIASLIERDINNPQITVRVVNGFFILEGVARDLDERDEALRIAQAYMPAGVSEFAAPAPFPGSTIIRKKVVSDGEYVLGNVINHLRIQPEPPSQPPKVIQIIVHYVELQKTYQRGFSFQWIPTLGDSSGLELSANTSGATSVGGTITAIIQNLFPKLNWSREHGHARILQSVSLIVENGNQGKFTSQREIPFQVVGPMGQPSTEKSNVGINATITPTITGARSDIISMKIDFSVGEVLEPTQAGPVTSNNQVVTNITVRSGQSAAIGGLVTSRSSTAFNRMPAEAAGNPLFKLYASKDFSRGQSQFVVFVTPMIKSSASAGVDNVKRKFRLQK